jgi:chitinase
MVRFPASRALVGIAAALLATVTVTPIASAAASLTAAFTVTDMGTWKQGKYVISNGGTTASENWRIEFDVPAGTTVGNVWYGVKSGTASHVVIDAEYYNKVVAAGRNTEPYSPWFELFGSGQPANCRINGNKCDGSPDRPPGTPGNLNATGKATRTVSLSWSAAAPADFPIAGYDVAGGGTAAVTGTTALVSGLNPNTQYTFTVRARDTRGNLSAASAPATVTTNNPANDTTPPSVPGSLRSTGRGSSTVSLAWTASTDANGVSGYEVYRGSTLAAFVTGTAATVAGLSPSTQYTFTVRARDNYDNTSATSNAVTVTTDDVVGAGRYARVGYFVQWGIYGRQFFVKNLDTSGAAAKLTHINYAFTNLDPVNLTCLNGVTRGTTPNPQDPDQGTGAGDADADYGRPMTAAQSVDGVADTGFEKLRGNFNQLRKLKVKYPNLKVLISIGGWTYSKFFSDAAATDAARQKLVASCLDLYIKGNLRLAGGAGGPGAAADIFDGIDLDWEWPGSEGHPGNHVSPNDKHNNTLLIAEFRRQLDALTATTGKRYQLTTFTPADPAKVAAGWEISGSSNVFSYLDFANVQGYDFHGAGSDNSWEPNRTGHQANWNTDVDDPYGVHFSAENALQIYASAGVNPRKLTIGIPFYGRGWQNVADGGRSGEWQTANGAAPGQFQEEAGTRGYNNLRSSFPNLTIVHDQQALATSGYTGANGQWWTFDDPWSIGQKMAIVKQKNLLGAMIWEMSGDNGTLMPAIDTGLS